MWLVNRLNEKLKQEASAREEAAKALQSKMAAAKRRR